HPYLSLEIGGRRQEDLSTLNIPRGSVSVRSTVETVHYQNHPRVSERKNLPLPGSDSTVPLSALERREPRSGMCLGNLSRFSHLNIARVLPGVRPVTRKSRYL